MIEIDDDCCLQHRTMYRRGKHKFSLHRTPFESQDTIIESPRLNEGRVSMAWETSSVSSQKHAHAMPLVMTPAKSSYRQEWLDALSILFTGWRAPIDPSDNAARVYRLSTELSRYHETRQLHCTRGERACEIRLDLFSASSLHNKPAGSN